MDITIPASTPLGVYWVGVKAFDADGVYTRFRIEINLIEGGGGCVAESTPILMTNGESLRVEELRAGDSVIGYDVKKGTLQKLKVESVTSSRVDRLLIINDGLLRVTPIDQPIYMKNDSFEGWLVDPQDLQLGDLLFDAVQEAWIEVTGLRYEGGTFTVYDVRTSHSNTFIANGILLDAKEP